MEALSGRLKARMERERAITCCSGPDGAEPVAAPVWTSRSSRPRQDGRTAKSLDGDLHSRTLSALYRRDSDEIGR